MLPSVSVSLIFVLQKADSHSKIFSLSSFFVGENPRMEGVEVALPGQINLNIPRWDQSTFWGRFRHFLAITDWRKAIHTNAELDEAKEVVEAYE